LKIEKSEGVSSPPERNNFFHFTFHAFEGVNLSGKVVNIAANYKIMETLERNKKNIFEEQNSYIRIVDVINFEAPLLTLYLNSVNNQLYLLDWFDVGTTYNECLIYLTTLASIDKYIHKKNSLLDLFMEGQSTCTSVDIDAGYILTNPQFLLKSATI